MATKNPPAPATKQPPNPDTLAEAIVKIEGSMTKLVKSGLNRRAIVVLIKDDCNVPMVDITRVLDSLASLAQKYTR